MTLDRLAGALALLALTCGTAAAETTNCPAGTDIAHAFRRF